MQEKKDTLPPQIAGGKGQTVRPAAGAFSLASGPPRRSSRRRKESPACPVKGKAGSLIGAGPASCASYFRLCRYALPVSIVDTLPGAVSRSSSAAGGPGKVEDGPQIGAGRCLRWTRCGADRAGPRRSDRRRCAFSSAAGRGRSPGPVRGCGVIAFPAPRLQSLLPV